MKKLLSVILSACILLSITTGMGITANAAASSKEKILTANAVKIKNYIKANGFINGNGNFTLQNFDYNDDYDFYSLMIVDASTDALSFSLNVNDSADDTLAFTLTLDLSSPTKEIKYIDAHYFDGVSDYSVYGGHAYVNQNYHDESNNIAFYLDYNDIDIDTATAVSLFSILTSYAFSSWNTMLIQEMNMNLGAVGFLKYCTQHKWNSGEVTKKASPTATGVKTHTCTLCGATKTVTIKKCAKYENPIVAKGKTATVKVKDVKKKSQTIAQKKAFSISKAQGKVTYKKTGGNKNITVASSGKITVKKGLKKGTYKIKVKVTAAGNATYKAATKTVTVTIKVN